MEQNGTEWNRMDINGIKRSRREKLQAFFSFYLEDVIMKPLDLQPMS
jgi:hypothetical protein